MKMRISNIFLLALIGISVAATSCKKKEGCMDPQAENYDPDAEVDNASCVYARDKFIGTYSVDLVCVYGDDSTYTMQVTKGPNVDEIIFENFGNYNIDIVAKVAGSNLSFNDEQLGGVFEGDGYIVDGNMSVSYEVCEADYYPCSDPEYCTMTCVKQ